MPPRSSACSPTNVSGRKSNKNDMADAEAICEAVARPNMKLVAIKNAEQQAVLALHRARHGFVKARTAQGNQIRGLLAEFGLIVPQGIAHIAKRVPELIEDATNDLPGSFRLLVQRELDQLKELDRQVSEIEAVGPVPSQSVSTKVLRSTYN